MTATAQANPNLALIKYWGNRDEGLRLPANGSISMTLGELHTVTRVTFQVDREGDRVVLQGAPAAAPASERVSRHLDLIRDSAGLRAGADVVSTSDFPIGAGLASSASAFAALTVAAAAAARLSLRPMELSRLARRGSGSACRSIFGGFVEWFAGTDDATSFAAPLAPEGHWPLVDLVAVIRAEEKSLGSTEGHRLASTSPLQPQRVAGAAARLTACRQAILLRDFDALASIVEEDSDLMHAVMETSSPPLHYRLAATDALISAVRRWRKAGLAVCTSVDAGPNVHCLCPIDAADTVEARLAAQPGVGRVIRASVGAAARLLSPDDPLTRLI